VSANKSKDEVVEEFRIQSIQDAALRVIARKGLTGASMQEIAEEAGIAKGTIYLYFDNQQDLLERTVDGALSKLHERLEQALAATGKFRQRLRNLIQTQVDFFDAHHDLFRLYSAMKYPEGADPQAARCSRSQRPQYQIFQQKLIGFLHQAIEDGDVRELDPERLALFMEEGVIAVIMQRLGEDESPEASEDVDWIVSLILDGVSKKRSRA